MGGKVGLLDNKITACRHRKLMAVSDRTNFDSDSLNPNTGNVFHNLCSISGKEGKNAGEADTAESKALYIKATIISRYTDGNLAISLQ